MQLKIKNKIKNKTRLRSISTILLAYQLYSLGDFRLLGLMNVRKSRRTERLVGVASPLQLPATATPSIKAKSIDPLDDWLATGLIGEGQTFGSGAPSNVPLSLGSLSHSRHGQQCASARGPDLTICAKNRNAHTFH
jgi:hypothetical protein